MVQDTYFHTVNILSLLNTDRIQNSINLNGINFKGICNIQRDNGGGGYLKLSF